jgi:hypothetical protein
MKKQKIAFWITTGFIFLFEGVLVAFTSHTKPAIDGITGLGYPLYFVTLLAVFKVVGTIVLIVPKIPGRIKEWAYAGFGIDFISATVSIIAVMGFTAGIALPLACLVILVISYRSYHKLKAANILFKN